MDPWILLQIIPTNDPRQIKRAYAEQLKIFHPEEFPERFGALQEAYQFALRYAKNNALGSQNEVINLETLNQPIPAEPAPFDSQKFNELTTHSSTLDALDKEPQPSSDDYEKFKFNELGGYSTTLDSPDQALQTNTDDLEQKYSEIEQYNRYVETVQKLNELVKQFAVLRSKKHKLRSFWKNKSKRLQMQNIKNELEINAQEILDGIALIIANKNQLTDHCFQTLYPAMRKLLEKDRKGKRINRTLLNRIVLHSTKLNAVDRAIKNQAMKARIIMNFKLLLMGFALATTFLIIRTLGKTHSGPYPNRYSPIPNPAYTVSLPYDTSSMLDRIRSYMQGYGSDGPSEITIYPRLNSDGTYAWVTSDDSDSQNSSDSHTSSDSQTSSGG